jgi:uncharacterized protein YkwD
MLNRCLLAALALTATATSSEAGPFRRSHATYQPAYQPTYQPVYQSPTSPYVVSASGVIIGSTPVVTTADSVGGTPSVVVPAGATESGLEGDGLDEVNAQRARRGLRPFVRDEGLTQAARACAGFRANHGLFGHTSNDFAFVPAGSYASSAGCAAYPASYGWMSCCVYENYTYAGAAWVTGRDGKRYMHLFVR